MSTGPANSTGTMYDRAFYDNHSAGSSRSAQLVLGHVFESIRPGSVVDVGCGEGHWLAVASSMGARRVLGLDGDYVDRGRLVIPADRFKAADLSKPFPVEESFDLAISMEVAEHLDPDAAERFVAQLVALAPAVLFSAAVPGQGGTDHRNEQWPSYWAKLFETHGYSCHDLVRPRFWHDERIELWYRQNTFVFLSADHPMADDDEFSNSLTASPMDAMHPGILALAMDRLERRARAAEEPSIRIAGRRLGDAMMRRLRRGLAK